MLCVLSFFFSAVLLVKTSGIFNMEHFNAEIKLFYGKIKHIRQILLFHAEYFSFSFIRIDAVMH